VPFLKGEKYGYSDLDRNLVVDAIYDNAKSMNRGIGVVTKAGSIGAVNQIGNTIAEFKYQDIYIEEANDKTYLIVKQNKLYGLIDDKGVEIIPCEFEDVSFWGKDFVGVDAKRCIIFDDKYKKVAQVEGLSVVFNKEQRILYSIDEKREVAFFNNRGKRILKVKKFTNIIPIGSDFVIVEKEDAVTIITSKGKVVEKSEKIEDYISDRQWLKIKTKGQWSLLNSDGDYVMESEYDEIKIVNDFLISGKRGKKSALFDYQGNKISGFEFTQVHKYRSTDKYIKAFKGIDHDILFADGKPTAIKSVFQVTEKTLNTDQVIFKEEKWGVITFEGDTIIRPTWDRLLTTKSEKNYRVKKNELFGLLSYDGKVLINAEYDELTEKDDYYLGVIDEVGYVFNMAGEKISSVQYSWGPQLKVPFNLFAVSDGEKYGVIDAKGELIVPVEFDKIDSLSGLIIVSKGIDKYAYHLDGERVFEEPYLDFQRTDLWLKVIKKGESYNYTGLYNLDQKMWFLEPDWKDIKLFNKDRYFTLKSKIDYYGIADTNYKLLVNPIYDELKPYNDNSELYLKVTDQGYFLMRIDGSLVYDEPFEDVRVWRGTIDFIFKVMREERLGLMDFEGNMILEVEYEEIANAPVEGEKYLIIGKEGKYGRINNKGEIIIQPIYSDISQQEDGWFWVLENPTSKPYLIDPNGKAYSDHLTESAN
jgi:hypothetical protein